MKVTRPILVAVFEMLKRFVKSLTKSLASLKSFFPTLTDESTTKTRSTKALEQQTEYVGIWDYTMTTFYTVNDMLKVF